MQAEYEAPRNGVKKLLSITLIIYHAVYCNGKVDIIKKFSANKHQIHFVDIMTVRRLIVD